MQQSIYDHITIFRIKNEYTNFSGSEYLEIYPYIFNIDSSQYFKGNYKSQGTYVVYPSINGNDRVIPIAEWLRNR